MNQTIVRAFSSLALLLLGGMMGHVLLTPRPLEAAPPETAPVGFSVSGDRSTLYFTKAGKLYFYEGGQLPNGTPGLTLQGSISLDAVGEASIPVTIAPNAAEGEAKGLPEKRQR